MPEPNSLSIRLPARATIGQGSTVHYLSRKHRGETTCGLRPLLTHGPLHRTDSPATCPACVRHVHGTPPPEAA